MELEVVKETAKTEVGNYFIANYPPFSAWNVGDVPFVHEKLNSPTAAPPPLGLYLHIPFCRKRCHFCYFRVYTDKNSNDVENYVSSLACEVALYAKLPALQGRSFEFVYFGGGTPSFLSSEQLEHLVERIREHWTWESAREVTFECEPGTLKKSKLETIRKIGTTRLSLGVEHFDDEVLSINGRAHKSKEIGLAYEWAREVGFPQINIDLIAGMVGDTEHKWRETVERALRLSPDSLTIYQLEVPHNTTIARNAKQENNQPPVVDWATKRAWVDYAFTLFEKSGYEVSSAYTLVKSASRAGFVYRDAVWHGADMIGTGVASFSHFSGVHFQNVDQWDAYLSKVQAGVLPIARALRVSRDQLTIRELILQLKLGRIEPDYFRHKFGVDVREQYRSAIGSLVADGWMENNGSLRLNRRGLLCVDALLPRFFEPEFRTARYT